MAFVLAEAAQKAQVLNDEIRGIVADIKDSNEKYRSLKELPKNIFDGDQKIKLVFVGQYSAGKSSILKMLTGKDDIDVGVGITTQQSHVYEWNGMEVIDTPGIATGIRLDHDKIAYQAITKADLLVFVITNELFTPLILENFKKLAYDDLNTEDGCAKFGKANEMILVVNKMERIGNVEEKRKMLRYELYNNSEVSENIEIGFVDAQSYIDSINESDAELKQELVEASGYNLFVELLNAFVQKKGTVAKVVSPIKHLQDYVFTIIDKVESPLDDSNAREMENLLKDTIKLLNGAQREGNRHLLDIFDRHAHEIRMYGCDLADNIKDKKDEAQVKAEINEKLRTVNEACQRNLEDELESISGTIEHDLQDIFNLHFSNGFNAEVKMPGGSFDFSPILSKINAIPGAKILGSIKKEWILNVGHFFGHKFVPWEALKYLKWIGKFSKWLSIIGKIFSTLLTIWDHHKKEQKRKELEEIQRQIRAGFNDIADDLENNGRAFVRDNFGKKMEELIAEQEGALAVFDQLRVDNSENCKKLKGCVKKLNCLLKELDA